MAWPEAAAVEVKNLFLDLWPMLDAGQALQLCRALERHSPHAVKAAAQKLYASQERPRRPAPRELEVLITGNEHGAMSERLAALTEMQTIERRLHDLPSVTRDGFAWELSSSCLSRPARPGDWSVSSVLAVPLGELDLGELRECLACMRSQEAREARQP